MSADPAASAPADRPLHAQLGALARLVQSTARPGDLAELRRGRPDSVPGFAFWRTLAQAEVHPREDELSAYIVALGLMAMAHGRHAPTVRFGAALAQAGVDEKRVLALLRAAPPLLYDQARGVVHLLDSKGVAFDHAELAALVVGTHADLAERVRRRVAADFFGASAAATASSSPSSTPSTTAPTA